MKSTLLVLSFLALAGQCLASSIEERAAITFKRITQSVAEGQLSSGAWQGVIEADASVDLMPLVLAKKLNLTNPQLEEETFERIFKAQDPKTGFWSAYPGGERSSDATGTIILTLKYLGISENDPRVSRAWDWLGSEMVHKKVLSPGNRLIGVMGEWLPRNVFLTVTPKFMAIPDSLPVNIHKIGFTRLALVPYTVWGHYYKAIQNKSKVAPLDKARVASRGSLLAKPKKDFSSEFWAQEGIGWLLDRQQADGTWGGALQMTYFSMLALHQAQLAGVGDFTPQIEKAWKGIMGWRTKIPEGSMIQQSTVGPVMDTARILSAVEAAPKNIGLESLPENNRAQAIDWLLSQQITKKGDWSAMLPDLIPGGWTFEYYNDFNPDADDTAMVIEGLAKSDLSQFPQAGVALERGVTWLTGLQNIDGGFPAWDKGVTPLLKIALKAIKFPEMSDDSQVDITSRSIKAMVAYKNAFPETKLVSRAIKKACRYLTKERNRTADSSFRLWRGEWMTNYLYGTSEAVGALLESGCWSVEEAQPYVEWFLARQQADGGWGESPEGYNLKTFVKAPSTLSQSEWVIHFLTIYEKARLNSKSNLPSVMKSIEGGVGFLVDRMGEAKSPYETEFTGTFVRGVWYARYVSLAHYEGIRALGGYLSLK